MGDQMFTYDGGCECGKVRYRMTSEPIFVSCCHCRDCQKITGSAFATNAMIETDRLKLLQGAGSLATADGVTRCGSCGSLLWATHRMFGDGISYLRVGTLDEGERLSPNAHFFVRSKYPWVTIPQGVPSFDVLPREGDRPLMTPESQARLMAVQGS